MNDLLSKLIIIIIVILCLVLSLRYWLSPLTLDKKTYEALYDKPATVPERALNIYHLGHSLIGHDMPYMLKQLATSGHSYSSQLGWGTPLKAHWEHDIKINGFEKENDHPYFKPAFDALSSGEYDVLIVTEMVELEAAIKYFDSHEYLHKWTSLARQANPSINVYLYETWHSLNDSNDWLNRLNNDLSELWEEKILRRALAYDTPAKPIYIIPGGQVFANFVKHIENSDGIENIKSRSDLFSDDIHFNDYGAYLMALTHYAVIYQRSPVGLPHSLQKANGSPARDPGPKLAAIMQAVVWETVSNYNKSGVLK